MPTEGRSDPLKLRGDNDRLVLLFPWRLSAERLITFHFAFDEAELQRDQNKKEVDHSKQLLVPSALGESGRTSGLQRSTVQREPEVMCPVKNILPREE